MVDNLVAKYSIHLLEGLTLGLGETRSRLSAKRTIKQTELETHKNMTIIPADANGKGEETRQYMLMRRDDTRNRDSGFRTRPWNLPFMMFVQMNTR